MSSILSEAKLDNTILDITEKAYQLIPKDMLDSLGERKEEFLFDLSDAIELVIRDHFSISVEEFLKPTGGSENLSLTVDKIP